MSNSQQPWVDGVCEALRSVIEGQVEERGSPERSGRVSGESAKRSSERVSGVHTRVDLR